MQNDTLAPCHICGERPRVIGDARGLLGDNAWRVTCHPSTAIYPTRDQAVAAWNDDARAREVLRAVETFDRAQSTLSAGVILDEWHVGADTHVVVASELRDALVALAGKVER